MFLKLLLEIQEQIISYCSIDDLKNLACTNCEYSQVLKGMLYHTVRFPHKLHEVHFNNNNMFENLKHVRVLYASCDFIPQWVFNAISKFDNLYKLSLQGSKSVNDLNIVILCDRMLRLRVLNIGSTEVTDEGFIHIQKL